MKSVPLWRPQYYYSNVLSFNIKLGIVLDKLPDRLPGYCSPKDERWGL